MMFFLLVVDLSLSDIIDPLYPIESHRESSASIPLCHPMEVQSIPSTSMRNHGIFGCSNGQKDPASSPLYPYHPHEKYREVSPSFFDACSPCFLVIYSCKIIFFDGCSPFFLVVMYSCKLNLHCGKPTKRMSTIFRTDFPMGSPLPHRFAPGYVPKEDSCVYPITSYYHQLCLSNHHVW